MAQGVFDLPSGKPFKLYATPIQAFKEGQGWDAKDPVSGLELIHKPAFILITADPNIDIAADDTPPDGIVRLLDKFILQSITENRKEKVQILETFDKNANLSFFGSTTKVYQISGTCLEANGGPIKNHYKWASTFKHFYENYLRGTQLVKNKKIAVLAAQENLFYCYPISLNISNNSTSQHLATFSMEMIVTDHILTAGVKGRPLSEEFRFQNDLKDWLGIVKAEKEYSAARQKSTYTLWGTHIKEQRAAFTDYIGKEAKYGVLKAAEADLQKTYGLALDNTNISPAYLLIVKAAAQEKVDEADRKYYSTINDYWKERPSDAEKYR